MQPEKCLEDNMRDKELEIARILHALEQDDMELDDPRILEPRTLEEMDLVLKQLESGKIDACPDWFKSRVTS
ncbi:hypothetical protein GF325_05690 [Candidatus Bathyarchaeota archaeon]|nr:hypothetical protein [Candidatus Bathyarchaeota archaeon]